jgi:hypothetical protein
MTKPTADLNHVLLKIAHPDLYERNPFNVLNLPVTATVQYPKLSIRYSEAFHDRFLIIDDRELYLVGASLKDLGRKCFGFTKMDAGEIRRIKKTAFAERQLVEGQGEGGRGEKGWAGGGR